MCFLDYNFTERTENDFKNKTDENHHIGQTILTRIPGLGCISCSFRLYAFYATGSYKKVIKNLDF